jgi:hypothetical protein
MVQYDINNKIFRMQNYVYPHVKKIGPIPIGPILLGQPRKGSKGKHIRQLVHFAFNI